MVFGSKIAVSGTGCCTTSTGACGICCSGIILFLLNPAAKFAALV